MYDRILVPTDGSEGMSRVVDHAVELARFHDAEVHGLYVVDTGSYATLPVETTWDGVTEMLREEGELALESLETMTGDLEVVTATEEGAPSKQIVEYARENGCDTIVMGTHGRGGLDRILLGSVAERVVRSSPVPVVTVPVGDTDVGPGDDEPEASVTQ
ncbi:MULTISPECIES: universal stress protein [Haloarcula]|uniref:Universal stress protein UspA n=1 Tax=Haloarcula pellucida TaxID=1427151 RepID=A0A830GJK9_9EURY|nr:MULTISPECIES: universal stress protein [Halomicroarcula]MBX0347835.1 universal stress protein [Halomicroarcula pellucida]MDS0276231.1 universal stress protein [Halomicroarcula sp. S1AR25-4]GGN90504.1 universal stress protein UspA [Halomicroarcula pellucida]